MALAEHLKQELVVGLYDRGAEQPSSKRVLDIGSSKILKSGIWSPYLVNLRTALSVDTESAVPIDRQRRVISLLVQAVGGEIDDLAKRHGFFHVYGPPEAGTPLASAVAGANGHSLLWRRVVPKPGYGSHQTLEGIYLPGQQVVQVDDVVTTAGTKVEEAEFLRSNELNSIAVAIVFDREQGGARAIAETGMDFGAALGATAAFGYLLDANRLTQSEHDYLVEYTNNPAPRSEPSDFPWK